MNDVCKTKEIMVTIQENGLIRAPDGYIVARLYNEISFDSEHLLCQNLTSRRSRAADTHVFWRKYGSNYVPKTNEIR